MEALKLVVYQNDPRTAQSLVVGLSQHFGSVKLAKEYEELRPALARTRADVLVLDLETSHPDDIGRLHREFPTLCIVGTHRLADDQLWAEALDQGAADLCEPRDNEIVRSVLHEFAQHAA